MPLGDVHAPNGAASDDPARRRREFLKLAGGAAALGGAATVLTSSPANADVEDDLAAHIADVVTVDGLPQAATPLTGAEVLHGVQDSDDVQFTADQLLGSGLVPPAGLKHTSASVGSSGYTWAAPVTHVLGSDDTVERTLTLPHHDFTGSAYVPSVRVLQMGAAKIRIVAGTDATVVSKASGSPGSVRTSVRYGGVTAEAIVDYGGVTVWVVSGDIEAY